jgi:hypothetical protein
MGDIVQVGDEMPDFIDGIDDFAKMKWFAAGVKREAERQRVMKLAEERAAKRKPWVDDGKVALGTLNKKMSGVHQILGPHRLHKDLCLELLNTVTEMQEKGRKEHKTKFFSTQLLYYIKPPLFLQNRKSFLIRYKWHVNLELRRVLDASKNFSGGELTLPQRGGESKALRIMESSVRKLVALPQDKVATLKADRAKLNALLAEMKVIQDTIASYEATKTCTSMLHKTPAGCPVCGVILMGGTIEPMAMVRAIDRVSGTFKLEKLETDLAKQRADESKQQIAIDNFYEEIHVLEQIMFKLARDNIQAWWASLLAKWHSSRDDKARVNKLWFYRIRRLARLKKEIDATPGRSMNFEQLEYTYSDLLPELKEYCAKVVADRNDIAERVGKEFVKRLKKVVARARRKRYMEDEAAKRDREAAQELIAKKKKAAEILAMRKLWKTLSKRKFICIREKCDGREFFSVERYRAHMSIHAIEDVKREEKIRRDKLTQATKEQESDLVEERLAAIRDHVYDSVRAEQSKKKELEEAMKYIDPQNVDLADTTFLERSDWTSQPHFSVINHRTNARLYHLELLSKSHEIEAPDLVGLDKAHVRFGSLPLLECSVLMKGRAKKEAIIARTHCTITCPLASDFNSDIRLTDNHTTYGTYIVSAGDPNAVKVTTSVTDGQKLCHGDLICIGVKKNGGPKLEAVDACEASIVYRVCLRQEELAVKSMKTKEEKVLGI